MRSRRFWLRSAVPGILGKEAVPIAAKKLHLRRLVWPSSVVGGIPPAFRNHRDATASETPAPIAAPQLHRPAALNLQNCRRSSRRATPRRPVERNFPHRAQSECCRPAIATTLRLGVATATGFHLACPCHYDGSGLPLPDGGRAAPVPELQGKTLCRCGAPGCRVGWEDAKASISAHRAAIRLTVGHGVRSTSNMSACALRLKRQMSAKPDTFP